MIYVIPDSKLQAYRTIYGIPAKRSIIINEQNLTYIQIKANVDKFLKRAMNTPKQQYLVIAFGKPEEIGPMFALATNNVVLPPSWEGYKRLPTSFFD
jgi:hypothetical protein